MDYELNQKLTEFRKQLGLNKKEFADKVGCKIQHISQMEIGTSPVSYKTLRRFVEIFGYKLTLNIEL